MYAILSRLVWLLNFAAMYKLIRNKVRKGRQKDQVQVGDKKKQKKSKWKQAKEEGRLLEKDWRTRQQTDVLEKNLN